MTKLTGRIAATVAAFTVAVAGTWALAQNQMGMGFGHMGGQHQGQGPMAHGAGMGGPGMTYMFRGHDTTEAETGELIEMFARNALITRTVENLPDGIRTVTSSADPTLAAAITSHVVGMIERVEDNRDPKLMIQSPTLDILFRNRDLITTVLEPTADGIVVTQTSADADTVAALQTHAAEVTDMAERGMLSVHERMMGTGGRHP